MAIKLLDLFCGAGGCSVGYSRAGLDVVGVDFQPQPNYPFEFIQADAIEYLRAEGHRYDAIHASPPCQAYSNTQRIRSKRHPAMLDVVRNAMPPKPWVIENVTDAPLIDPIVLCGHSFGLGTYRHRLFESSINLVAPPHRVHNLPITKMGRKPKPGEMMHVVGNFSGVNAARLAMGIDWMTRDELKQAIPPAYTEFIGLQLRAVFLTKAAWSY